MSAVPPGVKPTLSELEKFEEQPEGMDVELARSAKAEEEHLFTPGDNVEVVEGELINLQGTIVKIDGTKVTIMPKHEDLKVSPSWGGWQAVCRSVEPAWCVQYPLRRCAARWNGAASSAADCGRCLVLNQTTGRAWDWERQGELRVPRLSPIQLSPSRFLRYFLCLGIL